MNTDWVETPPTEPGWYWFAMRTHGGDWSSNVFACPVEIRATNGKAYAVIGALNSAMLFNVDRLEGYGLWHPKPIAHPPGSSRDGDAFTIIEDEWRKCVDLAEKYRRDGNDKDANIAQAGADALRGAAWMIRPGVALKRGSAAKEGG